VTGNVTAERIAPALTSRTKAISVVHYAGIPCAMPDIVALAQERGLKVVEDCAISIGTRWEGKHVGLFGDIGCFSFYPVKHITTAEGGMFVSKHAAVVESVARLRAFGVDRTHTERTVPGMYDVPTLGLNYRMSELQAALGRSQIQRIGATLRTRRANFRQLQKALTGVPGLRVIDTNEPKAESSFYCLTLVLEGPLAGKRNAAVARLNAAGVGTSVYYPQPVPRMTYYRKKYGEDAAARYRNAAEISDESIALPVGPHLGDDDIRYVGETVLTVMEGLR
jgi:dTDP-4-amino-4,6-dideoxygalactose transaminase